VEKFADKPLSEVIMRIALLIMLLSTSVFARKATMNQFTKEMQKELSVVSENPHLYETKPLRKPASVETDPASENAEKMVDQMEEDYNYLKTGNQDW
jgi:hypothetical protein